MKDASTSPGSWRYVYNHDLGLKKHIKATAFRMGIERKSDRIDSLYQEFLLFLGSGRRAFYLKSIFQQAGRWRPYPTESDNRYSLHLFFIWLQGKQLLPSYKSSPNPRIGPRQSGGSLFDFTQPTKKPPLRRFIFSLFS